MRTSFHHQPEAQHPNFPLFTSWQADYPIFRGQSGHGLLQEMKQAWPARFVSGRFAIYVVDAKLFESTAGDTDRCLESSPGVVRDWARVNNPESVMRRLPRRKVK